MRVRPSHLPHVAILPLALSVYLASGWGDALTAQESADWAFGMESVTRIHLPPSVAEHALLLELEHDARRMRPPGLRRDLNADGVDEYIVQSAPSLCGNAGCVYALFDGASGAGLGVVFGNPIYVREQRVNDFPVIHSFAHLSAESGTYSTFVHGDEGYVRVSQVVVAGSSMERLFEELEQIPVISPGEER